MIYALTDVSSICLESSLTNQTNKEMCENIEFTDKKTYKYNSGW